MRHNSGWIERYSRLSSMGWDELRDRVRQETAKRWDAITRIGASFQTESYTPSVGSLGRFFFGHAELPALLDLLRETRPDAVEKIIAYAEDICRHRFDLLGYTGVDYGQEIDWHLDAVHGKQAPRHLWFRIPYLDFEQVGDAKIIWELSRHQHLVTLAKAYRLTGKIGYLGELVQQWYHWQEHNPYGIGINWSSSLEVAFRSLSWIWILQLLDHCPAAPPAFAIDVSRALLMNARHIERFLSTYFSPNTHLLGEGVGLFFTGTLVSGSRRARNWQEHGWNIILQEAKRQVLPDGMHFEQSTYYHVYALDFFLHARILAGLNKVDIPAAFDQTITSMLTALAKLAQPGPPPNFGDDDGGRVFDSRRNLREHLTDPLSTGAVVFNNSDWKGPSCGISEETIWLLGIEGANPFCGMETHPRHVNSFTLESSGIYVMSGSKHNSQQLIVDAGPHATRRCGHAHADALSVQLSVNGRNILVDPGTAVYADRNGDRDRFRNTAAHNSVQVDGMSQADPAGPFGWRGLPTVIPDCWVSAETFDLFEGSHDGYTRLPDPVFHRRHIFYLRDRVWLIRDVLTGEERHEIQASWHFAPGKLAAVRGGAKFTHPGGEGLILLVAGGTDCRQNIVPDLCSPVYGQKMPAPTLHIHVDAPLPLEFATLFIPECQFGSLPGFFQRIEGNRSSSFAQAYLYSTAAEESYFVFSEAAGDWQIGPMASDARFLFCRLDANGAPAQFVFCHGSYLELRGQPVFASTTRVARAEWDQSGSTPHFSCSDDAAVTLHPLQLLGTPV
jgi:hypothetical protein